MTPKQRKEIERRAKANSMPAAISIEGKQIISQLREDVRVTLKALDQMTRQKEMWESRSRVLNDRLRGDTDLLS